MARISISRSSSSRTKPAVKPPVVETAQPEQPEASPAPAPMNMSLLMSAMSMPPSYTPVTLTNSSNAYTHNANGNYRIEGLGGNDTITVALNSTGGDYLDGGTGNDTLNAANSDDILDGGDGTDRLYGNGGNDILRGGAGSDTISGGDGIDAVDYSTSNAGVTLTLAADPARTARGSGGHATGDTVGGVENILGSAFSDRLTGNLLANLLVGAAGDDILRGMDGDDVLIGDSMIDADQNGVPDDEDNDGIPDGVNEATEGGDDFLDGGFGNDRLYGGAGDDTLNGGFGDDVMYGGEGDDLLSGSDGHDLLDGGNGDDMLVASLGNDILRGGDGNDFMDASIGDDLLDGGDGDDEMHAGPGNDTMDGGDGNDRLFGGGGDDTMSGGIGDDEMEGGDGDDVMNGGDGDDILRPGIGVNVVDGGAGADTLDFSAQGPIGINLGDGAVSGAATGTTFSNIENVKGSAFDDIIVGDSGNNTLTGGDGADQLVGQGGFDTSDYSDSAEAVTVTLNSTAADPNAAGSGQGGDAEGDVLISIERVVGSALADTLTGGELNDTFMGAGGGDVIDGGLGIDTAEYSSSAGGVTVALAAGGATSIGVGGDADGDLLTAIESLIGSAHADTLRGNDQVNRIDAGAGDDMLRSGTGGGLTPETFEIMIGGDGIDTIDYSQSTTGIAQARLNTGAGTTFISQGGEAHGDILLEIENIIGSSFDDWLVGSEIDNFMDGGSGKDRLDGGDGNDTFRTGTGGAITSPLNQALLELVFGGDGVDTIDYSLSNGAVLVRLNSGTSGSVSQGGHAHGDFLLQMENAIGSMFNDDIRGTEFANVLDGGDGNDLLAGLDGADTLIGGNGVDMADYSASTSAVNVNLATGAGLGGHAAGDVLVGIESVTGSNGSDLLRGDSGANKLISGAGNDLLYGGGGNDILSVTGTGAASGQNHVFGEDGTDTFRILGGTNFIRDYESGEQLAFNSLSSIGGLIGVGIGGVGHYASVFSGSTHSTYVIFGAFADMSASEATAIRTALLTNGDYTVDPGLIA